MFHKRSSKGSLSNKQSKQRNIIKTSKRHASKTTTKPKVPSKAQDKGWNDMMDNTLSDMNKSVTSTVRKIIPGIVEPSTASLHHYQNKRNHSSISSLLGSDIDNLSHEQDTWPSTCQSRLIKQYVNQAVLDVYSPKYTDVPRGSNQSNENLKVLHSTIHNIRVCGGIIAFTDGSSIKNPGPSGSGISIEIPYHNTRDELKMALKSPESNNDTYHFGVRYDISLAHGDATNNFSEMKAIESSLIYIDQIHDYYNIDIINKSIHIVTDSEWAINILTRRWAVNEKYHDMVNNIRSLMVYMEAKYKSRIHLTWCKGHNKLSGNHIADRLALAGSEYSNSINLDFQDEPYILSPETMIFPIRYALDRQTKMLDILEVSRLQSQLLLKTSEEHYNDISRQCNSISKYMQSYESSIQFSQQIDDFKETPPKTKLKPSEANKLYNTIISNALLVANAAQHGINSSLVSFDIVDSSYNINDNDDTTTTATTDNIKHITKSDQSDGNVKKSKTRKDNNTSEVKVDNTTNDVKTDDTTIEPPTIVKPTKKLTKAQQAKLDREAAQAQAVAEAEAIAKAEEEAIRQSEIQDSYIQEAIIEEEPEVVVPPTKTRAKRRTKAQIAQDKLVAEQAMAAAEAERAMAVEAEQTVAITAEDQHVEMEQTEQVIVKPVKKATTKRLTKAQKAEIAAQEAVELAAQQEQEQEAQQLQREEEEAHLATTTHKEPIEEEIEVVPTTKKTKTVKVKNITKKEQAALDKAAREAAETVESIEVVNNDEQQQQQQQEEEEAVNTTLSSKATKSTKKVKKLTKKEQAALDAAQLALNNEDNTTITITTTTTTTYDVDNDVDEDEARMMEELRILQEEAQQAAKEAEEAQERLIASQNAVLSSKMAAKTATAKRTKSSKVVSTTYDDDNDQENVVFVDEVPSSTPSPTTSTATSPSATKTTKAKKATSKQTDTPISPILPGIITRNYAPTEKAATIKKAKAATTTTKASRSKKSTIQDDDDDIVDTFSTDIYHAEVMEPISTKTTSARGKKSKSNDI